MQSAQPSYPGTVQKVFLTFLNVTLDEMRKEKLNSNCLKMFVKLESEHYMPIRRY